MNIPKFEGLNIGCGNDVRSNYINLDKVILPGVDIVWDANQYPYPLEDECITRVLMINVLEHIPNTIGMIEELYRICKPGALINIRVPYWNSLEQSTDPTHVRTFNELSFDYFDPSKDLCIRRPYYSKARFKIQSKGLWIFIYRYIYIRNAVVSKLLFGISHHISNIVRLLEFDLTVMKKS